MGADLMPTIREMIGAPQPENVKWDGISLLSLMTKEKPLPSRPMFWGLRNQLAIRKGDYKLITTQSFKSPELYNLNQDLGETRNIAAEHPELTAKLLKQLRKWHKNVNQGIKKRS
jgi:arylsulfatase A-like enzyme